jgi:hypothetical protein
MNKMLEDFFVELKLAADAFWMSFQEFNDPLYSRKSGGASGNLTVAMQHYAGSHKYMTIVQYCIALHSASVR